MEKSTLKLTLCSLASFLILGTLPIVGYGLKGHNVSDSDSRNWMKNVDGSKSIDVLSLPGTHDSGAAHNFMDFSGKCQDLSIKNQLEIGVRFLDLRLKQVNDNFAVYHSFINEDLSFDDVMADCTSFLKEHPTEALVISIKKEDSTENSTLSFDDALKTRLAKYGTGIYTSRDIPVLDAIRGKISIISRYYGSTIGIDAYQGWVDGFKDSNTFTFDISEKNKLHVQDFYHFKDMDLKIQEIKNCLEFTSGYSTGENKTLTMNFFSGYFEDGFPPTYSVPVAKKANAWAKDHLDKYSSTGIAIFDFITKDIAKAVWSKNL